MPFSDPIVAGDVLVRSAITSPDYEPGLSGWAVNADGQIEAADLLIRGPDGRYIRGYIEPVNSIPVLDFQPVASGVPGWSAAAGSMYEYADGNGFEVLGLASPVQNQPAATGEARIELRSGKAADPSTAVRLTADAVLIDRAGSAAPRLLDGKSNVFYLRGQRGTVPVTVSGVTTVLIPVSFPVPFPASSPIPEVFVNIASGAGAVAYCHARAINATRTGFTLFVFSRDAATNLAWTGQFVGWLAVIDA